MNYSELLTEYINQSNLSLGEIANRMTEKGIKIDRTYISMLKNNKTKNPASEEVNWALAEVTGGDPYKLLWAAQLEKADKSIREVLSLIDVNVITKAMKLTHKYPNYFRLSDEKKTKYEGNPDVNEFWDSFGESKDPYNLIKPFRR